MYTKTWKDLKRELNGSLSQFIQDIYRLSKANGFCNASNAYFMDQYDVKERTITRWVKTLVDLKLVKQEIVKCETTRKVLGRKLVMLFKIKSDKKPKEEMCSKLVEQSFIETFKETPNQKEVVALNEIVVEEEEAVVSEAIERSSKAHPWGRIKYIKKAIITVKMESKAKLERKEAEKVATEMSTSLGAYGVAPVNPDYYYDWMAN